jgi:hypothetical protein
LSSGREGRRVPLPVFFERVRKCKKGKDFRENVSARRVKRAQKQQEGKEIEEVKEVKEKRRGEWSGGR